MARLYDGKGTDDVDIWSVVDWRYYGIFTVPAKQKLGSRMHQYLDQIDKARSHGERILAYTYYGVPGFPSFSTSEPLSNPRMFVLWTALEGIDGILYGQGLTTYGSSGDPLASNIPGRGESVLIYPGNGAPIASARLEQIRAGAEDWDVFAIVRKRFGAAKVRQILGAHGLFSATASGVQLAMRSSARPGERRRRRPGPAGRTTRRPPAGSRPRAWTRSSSRRVEADSLEGVNQARRPASIQQVLSEAHRDDEVDDTARRRPALRTDPRR